MVYVMLGKYPLHVLKGEALPSACNTDILASVRRSVIGKMYMAKKCINLCGTCTRLEKQE